MRDVAVLCYDRHMFAHFCREKKLNPARAFDGEKYYFHATEMSIKGRRIWEVIKYGDWISDENLKLMPELQARFVR